MRGLFALSYALLWGLIVLEALLLREILRKTVWLKRLHADLIHRSGEEELEWLRTGTPAPNFTAPLLGTNTSLSMSQLKGHQSILLFVSADAPPPLYEKLDIAIHAMWHKTEGHLYLVCNGTAEGCRQLVSDHQVTQYTGDQLPILIDEGGRISQSFLINSTPQAVELDENIRVKRYGRPEPHKPAGDGQEGNGGQPTDALPDTDALPETDVTPAATIKLSHSENGREGERASMSEMRRAGGGGDGAKPCDWPDEHPTTGASFARIDTTVSCVMTRFRLRSVWSLVPFYLAFRRVRRSSRDVAGLLKATFLIEDLHTCYTMSLWKDECAIVDFGRVQAHVSAANSAFRPTWRKDLRRAEIWSAQFRLWAVSAHNLNWEGLDLQTVPADQWARRGQVARGEFLEEEEEVAHG